MHLHLPTCLYSAVSPSPQVVGGLALIHALRGINALRQLWITPLDILYNSKTRGWEGGTGATTQHYVCVCIYIYIHIHRNRNGNRNRNKIEIETEIEIEIDLYIHTLTYIQP